MANSNIAPPPCRDNSWAAPSCNASACNQAQSGAIRFDQTHTRYQPDSIVCSSLPRSGMRVATLSCRSGEAQRASRKVASLHPASRILCRFWHTSHECSERGPRSPEMHQASISSGHQRPSEAIKGHQRPSEAVSGHQWPSEAISGHQWPSVAIRGHSGHQWSSAAISGPQLPSSGHQQPSRVGQTHHHSQSPQR